jgi:hypothetical protein
VGRRVVTGVVAAACLLAFAGPASAGWKRYASGVTNSIEPSSLRTTAGSELIAWNTANALYLLRNGTLETLLSGQPSVDKPALVQQPDGTLQLYVPMQNATATLDGVVRLSSSDDGVTWSAPVQTQSHDLTDVGSAAVAPDGTPYFTQSGTGFVDVYEGLNGETVQNVFAGDCCGQGESVAVDSLGVARVAFWSDGNSAPKKFVLATVGGGMRTYGTESIVRDDRVPLVSFGTHTYLEWSNGYPTSKLVAVEFFPQGRNRILDRGKFTGGDPHMALALEPDGKLWALWTRNGLVRARRSRSNGVGWGAVVSVPVPKSSTAYQLEAFARPGSVEALLNTGDSLWEAKLLPGITVERFRGTAVVSDDIVRLKGATLEGGGRTLHTDARGRASLGKFKRGTLVRVTKAGYTPTSFRVR